MNPRVLRLLSGCLCLLTSASVAFGGIRQVYNLGAIEALALQAGDSPASVIFQRTDGRPESCKVRLAVEITGVVERNGGTAGFYDEVGLVVNGNTYIAFAGDPDPDGQWSVNPPDPFEGATKTATVQIEVQAGDTIALQYLTRNQYWNEGSAHISKVEIMSPGCAECAAGSGSVENQCVSLEIPLGTQTAAEESPGLLKLEIESPIAAAYDPASLELASGLFDLTEAEQALQNSETPPMVVVNENGDLWHAGEVIRQILTQAVFIDIVVTAVDGGGAPLAYEIRIYEPSRADARGMDGFYPVNGTASDTLYTWTVENPDISSTPANAFVRITKATPGNSQVFDFEWVPADGDWTLSRGLGAEKVTERRTTVVDGNITTETLVVTDDLDTVVHEESESYTTFAFGERLTQRTLGAGAEQLVTTFEYWPSASGLNRDGLLKRVSYPSGNWEYYHEYDASGRATKRVDQYLNNSYTGTWPDSVNRVTEIVRSETLVLLQEPFATDLGGFQVVSRDQTGQLWEHQTETGNGYAAGNGTGASGPMDCWLVSPALNLADIGNPLMSFRSRKDLTGPDIEVWVSTNYPGSGDPLASGVTWTDITDDFDLAVDTTWATSGTFSLNAFQSPATYVAFRYLSVGGATGEAASWSIDDVRIDHDTEYVEETSVRLGGELISKTWRLEREQTDLRFLWFQNLDDRVEITAEATDLSAATIFSPSNRITRNFYYAKDETAPPGDPGGIGRLPSRTVHSDGTLTLYEYEETISGGLITRRQQGLANAQLDAVIEGYLTVEEQNAQGELVSSDTHYIKEGEDDLLIDWMQATTFDALGRATTIIHGDGTTTTRVYGCCGLESETDREGIQTVYRYDTLGRLYRTETWAGTAMLSASEHTLDARGRPVADIRVGSDGTRQTIRQRGYLTNGDLDFEIDALGRQIELTTERQATGGFTITSQSLPDLPALDARVTTTYQDGNVYEESGLAVTPMRHAYAIETSPDNSNNHLEVRTAIVLDAHGGVSYSNGLPTTEFSEQAVSPGGAYQFSRRHAGDESGAIMAETWLDAAGRPLRQTGFDGATILFASDMFRTVEALDVDGDDEISDGVSEADAVRRTTLTFVEAHSTVVRRETVEALTEAGSWELVSQTDTETIDVNANGMETWLTQYTSTTHIIETINAGTRTRTVTSTRADGSGEAAVFQDGRLYQTYKIDTSDTASTRTVTTAYDIFGRTASVTDSLTGATDITYYDDDRIHTLTTPDPDTTQSGSGFDRQTTTLAYVLQSDGSELTTESLEQGESRHTLTDPRGRLVKSYGYGTYPQEYTYTPAGRVETLTTWQDFNETTGLGVSGAAVTRWQYNLAGLLQQKFFDWREDPGNPGQYLSEPGPLYAYHENGLLHTHTLPRNGSDSQPIIVTYDYDDGESGESHSRRLRSISYGSNTPETTDVAYTYDRQGRPATVTDASGVRQHVYEEGLLDRVTYLSGALAGLEVDRDYDLTTGRRLTRVAAGRTGEEPFHAADYAYADSFARLSTITVGTDSMTYSYRSDGIQATSLDYVRDSAPTFRHTWDWDNLDRITALGADDGTSPTPQVFHQTTRRYDDLNRAARDTQGDGRYWDYNYDALGQVTGAAKFQGPADPSPGAAIPGYGFGFAFDDIGNRASAARNGHSDDYTANSLNQIEAIDLAGIHPVLGSAAPTAGVTVNAAATTRTNELFFGEVTGANSLETITVTGTLTGQGDGGTDAVAEQSRTAYFPSGATSFTHDASGNLSQDETWDYTWDAENRLVTTETRASVATAGVPRQRLEFGYDSDGRRFRKQLFAWDDQQSAFVLVTETRFLWDGWLLIAELNFDPASDTLKTQCLYTWGLDLSGDRTAAAGIGGLVHVRHDQSGPLSAAPFYATNGNIAGYVDLIEGHVVAEYDYGPFGERVRATGPEAEAFTFRWSTKFRDVETGLSYYGFRYYNPSTGRWLSKDPIEEERGGLNLYGFVYNDPNGFVDPWGLQVAVAPTPVARPPVRAPLPPPPTINVGTPGGNVGPYVEWDPFLGVPIEINYFDADKLSIILRDRPLEIGSFPRDLEFVEPGTPLRGTSERFIWELRKKEEREREVRRQLNGLRQTVAKRGKEECCPTLELSQSSMPKITAFISRVMFRHPMPLHKGLGQEMADLNRADALRGFPRLGGQSRDEYPFASTLEGGVTASREWVPILEQSRQGGVINAFYQRNNMKPGDCFYVQIVP